MSNRVNKIQKCNFKIVYIPGELNPSDYVTKRTSVDKYLNNCLWQHGPEFLKENTEDILEKYEDIKNLNLEHKEEAQKELKPKLTINNNIVKKEECPETMHSSTLSNLIDEWSDFDKILRVTSLCLKTIALMTNGIKDLTRRSEIQQQSFSIAFIDENMQGGYKGALSPEQLETAKLYHIREAQKRAFEDYHILLNKGSIKESSKLAKRFIAGMTFKR